MIMCKYSVFTESTGTLIFSSLREDWCLAVSVVFYDGATALADKERVTGIIYLELCKAFNIVPCDNLLLNWRDVDLMYGPLGG